MTRETLIKLPNHGDTFTLHGRNFKFSCGYDDFPETPWEDDEHGLVSNWLVRHKLPGEMILTTDGELNLTTEGGAKRLYNLQKAVQIAMEEGWRSEGDEELTNNQRAYKAAMDQYNHYRTWCSDQWWYLYITVELLPRYDEEKVSCSLGGIESKDESYILEVVNELAKDCLAEDSKRPLTPLMLQERFIGTGEHPDYPLTDWQYEVSNLSTILGYWEWVAVRLASDCNVIGETK